MNATTRSFALLWVDSQTQWLRLLIEIALAVVGTVVIWQVVTSRRRLAEKGLDGRRRTTRFLVRERKLRFIAQRQSHSLSQRILTAHEGERRCLARESGGGMKRQGHNSPIKVLQWKLFGHGQIMTTRQGGGDFCSNLCNWPAQLHRCSARLMAVLVCVLFMTGCASRPVTGHWTQAQSAALKNRLLQTSGVDADDATRLAEVAVEESAALAHQYRAVRPAWLGNYLVNLGWRDRGLCYDWANGLYPRLHELGLRSLELHLAVARMDTRHEHNCIVVTAHQQPFAEGVVLDAWRHSGRLWFGSAATDKYPWQPLPRDRVPRELENLVGQ